MRDIILEVFMATSSGRRFGAGRLLAATLLLAATPVRAQSGPNDLRASVMAGTDYIRYGLSQNEHAPALRVAFDFEHKSGAFLGGSAGTVEYESEPRFGQERDTELNLYAGYLWRKKQWTTNITVARYVYPGFEPNYDYTDISINASFRDRYFLSVSRGDEYLAVLDSTTHVRAGLALPWIRNLEVGANIGRSRIDGFLDVSYTYWDVGVSRPFGRFAVDLRFHDSTNDASSLAGNAIDNEWVISVIYAFVPFQ